MKTKSLLFRKYVRILMIWMGGLSLLVGLVHMLIVAEAQRRSVAQLLDAEGRIASGQIESFLTNTVASLRLVDDIDQPGSEPDFEAIKDAGYRILRRERSLIGLAYFDRAGCERLSLSRLEPDTKFDCGNAPAGDARSGMFALVRKVGIAYGDVFFPDGSEPHVYVGIASRGKSTGAVIAEINLKVIHDSVAAIKVGSSGFGFIVDADNRLIAHPDELLVLRQTQLPHDYPDAASAQGLSFATDFAGRQVVTASQRMDRPAWRVVVEQPIREALAPVYAALWATGILVLAAIVGSLIAGMILANRLARPLSLLRDGAARIGQGDLSTRLSIRTGDEIEQVADEFNRMAGALDDSLVHLEAKVADRTAALQATTQTVQQQASELSQLNTALARSLDDAQRQKEEAERANAAKTRFLAVASHDLRQPMHAISLMVGLLNEKISDAAARDIVDKIQTSVGVMEDLFNSLLDLSKLDAGAVTPNLEEFPVAEILDRAAQSFEGPAAKKGLRLIVDSSPALVRSDAILLERIVFNLLSNAIRYTNAGAVQLRCEMAKSVLTIGVEDTGIGIPTEYQERIYDEFFQIAGPARDRSKGLGLGLSIVKRCCDLLGHQLTMQSGHGGSLFQIEVACSGIAAKTLDNATSSKAVSERLRSAFVLVIDDDAQSRYAAQATYQQWGCNVVASESVDDALDALARHLRSPDLIVTDFHLGKSWNGISGVEALRARAELMIPAIVLTGEIAALEPFQLDASFLVLQKPAGWERLREASERLLSLALPEPMPAYSET